MLDGFKKFVVQGSAVDIAVGIIIGAAFTAVVTALNTEVILPLVAAVVGEPSFDDVLRFEVNGSTVSIGVFITAVLNLLLVAGAVYFFIVAPINALRARRAAGEPEEPTTEEQILQVLERIADK